jgi:hypothetical protein
MECAQKSGSIDENAQSGRRMIARSDEILYHHVVAFGKNAIDVFIGLKAESFLVSQFTRERQNRPKEIRTELRMKNGDALVEKT